MQWPPTVSFPFNAGFVARERLPIRHYPHRDPAQLERRCRLRAVMMADAENSSNWTHPEQHHWAQANWRNFVTPNSQPALQHWDQGTDLTEVHYTNHLGKPHTRLAQWVAHRFLLKSLDRRRPRWPANAYPQRIPAKLAARLQNELQSAS
jgi:hypothetical protein